MLLQSKQKVSDIRGCHKIMQPILPREDECHTFVTDLCHTYSIIPTPCKLRFLKKGFYINAIKQQYFTFCDFYPMSKSNFRQMVRRLRPAVVTEINSNPAFYRLEGIIVNSNVTLRSRRVPQIRDVDPDFVALIESCKEQPVMMHDLRINTKTKDLYEPLVKKGHIPNEKNKAITVKSFLNRNLSTTINIYRKDTVQIMIGCTHFPLPYSTTGFNELIFHLGRVFEELAFNASHDFIYQPIGEWIIDYVHLNRDGVQIDAKKFNYTISQLANHSVFYIKKFSNGVIRPRYEEQIALHQNMIQAQCILSEQNDH